MSDETAGKNFTYWREVFKRTPKEFGIFEIGGGVISSILAWKIGLAKEGELSELIFLVLIGGSCGALLGFFFRLIFITPAKMYKGLQEKIRTNEAFVIHAAIWGKGENHRNVTPDALNHLNDGKFEMPLDFRILGDPLPKTRKNLTIYYSHNGKHLTKVFTEELDEVARLP